MLPGVLLSFALPALASSSRVLGVRPDLQRVYVPNKSNKPPTWRCLDGSQEIPWSSVNDDYCDCLDGSDEPGTGACPNTSFYCYNEGHIGTFIPSSRVRDGLCEPECCDGSDEAPGVCPNQCKRIAEEYAKTMEELNKVRRKGAKTRAKYIAFALQDKDRLEAVIKGLVTDIARQEREVERLRQIKEHSESLSAAEMDFKKQSPVYQSLEEHKQALQSYRSLHEKLKKREETLTQILSALREGYNPNYQDMAVLEAVRGWEAFAGLHPKGSDADNAGEKLTKEEEEEEALEEGQWSEDKLNNDLSALIDQDYMSLLLSHDSYVNSNNGTSPLMDLASYIPDSLLPSYISFKNSIVGALRTVGIVRTPDSQAKSEQANAALTAYNEADNELNNLRRQKEEREVELSELFMPEKYGAQGEWKKLDGTCLEKEIGEYTYEVCLFKSATQKSSNGGHNGLGSWSSWNTNVEPSDPAYYTKMHYTGGLQCWNGPQRSVTVELKCGTENVLHTVTEPEKCEYLITGESPALCLPLTGQETKPTSPKQDL